MPNMHAIALLSTGALIGTFVGFAIARRFSFAYPNDPSGPVGSSPLFNSVKRMTSWFDRGQSGAPLPAGKTDNLAFEAYKAETLQRLHEEQRQFEAFLDELRYAKDKAEFDRFLANKSSGQPAKPTQGI